jgi:hypothetical protein
MAIAPHALTLRCYGVGFGDCFLLTFRYRGATGDRHMLIDFGSTQRPPNAKRNYLGAIVKDIESVVGRGSQLHVLVATQRRADHINGFATRPGGRGTGDRIAALKPKLVIQPWTEDPRAPDASRDAVAGGGTTRAGRIVGTRGVGGVVRDEVLRLSLRRMETVASASLRELKALRPTLPKALADEVRFIGLGVESLSTMSAVKNLAKMGTRRGSEAAHVHYGMRVPALQTLLPGLQIDVLGPPTLAQKADLARRRSKDADASWQLATAEFVNFWAIRAETAALVPATISGQTLDTIPIEDRWFVRRLRNIRGRQLLGLVRAMDEALNNTSVILLIRAGSKKLLFPGDAQWENWEYALSRHADDVRDVDLYKVGHHGSLNGTPRTLWNLFTKKSKRKTDVGRLCTVLSTRSGSLHGQRERGNEVPREKLVRALEAFSTLRSTQELEPSGGIVLKLEIDLSD